MEPPSETPATPPSWLGPWAQRVPRWAWWPAAALAGAVAVVFVVSVLRSPSGPAPRLTLPQAGATEGALPPGASPATDPAGGPLAGPGAGGGTVGGGTVGGGAGGGAVGEGPGEGALATVHAAGAVASPGVYALPAGARVADLLAAAGGPLSEADLDRLNLAARVADGDRVYVPRRGEGEPPSTEVGGLAGAGGGPPTTAGLVDLNTATAAQLDTLPGVGPATANAIITYRTRHGPFRSVTELLEVPGIGPAKLESLRPLVKV